MRFYVRSSFLQKLFKYGLIFFFLIMLETVTIPLTREGAVIPDLLLCGVIAVGIGEVSADSYRAFSLTLSAARVLLFLPLFTLSAVILRACLPASSCAAIFFPI